MKMLLSIFGKPELKPDTIIFDKTERNLDMGII